MDEYIFYCLKDFWNDKECLYPEYIRTGIPIGSIEFVEGWLNQLHKIERINPIEVPVCLRKEEFLKRKYQILKKNELPQKGRIFFKDASQLKKFAEVIDCEYFFSEEMWKEPIQKSGASLKLDPTHLYQVSEIVKIYSEYRVYVMDDKIEAISNYNGDPCLLPDIKLLQKMVNIYSMQNERPRAYTMDLAINETGTFLLEVHPWISVGLYNSLWSRNLLYAYRDGIDYVLNFNVKPVEWN